MRMKVNKEIRLTNRIPCVNQQGKPVTVFEFTTFIENIRGLSGYRTADGKPVNRLDENHFEQVTLIGLPKLTRIK